MPMFLFIMVNYYKQKTLKSRYKYIGRVCILYQKQGIHNLHNCRWSKIAYL